MSKPVPVSLESFSSAVELFGKLMPELADETEEEPGWIQSVRFDGVNTASVNAASVTL